MTKKKCAECKAAVMDTDDWSIVAAPAPEAVRGVGTDGE